MALRRLSWGATDLLSNYGGACVREQTEFTSKNDTRSNLKSQFNEQLRCLQDKLEQDTGSLAELQEFYRRRAQVEQDYSEQLNKLAHSVKTKNAQQKPRRTNWPTYTTSDLWHSLVGSTLRVSQTHSTLSEVFGRQMTQRLTDMQEDSNRLAEKSKALTVASQDKISQGIKLLHSYLIEYQRRQRISLETADALTKEEIRLSKDTTKATQQGKDPERSKKVRAARNACCEKAQLHETARIASTQSRNEYLTQLAAVNAAVHKYFTDEMPDILDLMTFGFHNSLARAAMMHLSCEEAVQRSHQSITELLNENITKFDSRRDKKIFLEKNQAAFCLTQAFKYEPFKDDPVDHISAEGNIRSTLESTVEDIRTRLEELKLSTEEQWKTMEVVDKNLLSLINLQDYDVTSQFTMGGQNRHKESHGSISSPTGINETSSGIYTAMRTMHRDSRTEQEKFYLERFSQYMKDMHLYHVMQAKFQSIERSLGEVTGSIHGAPRKALRNKVPHIPQLLGPKLFGGTVDEYVVATGQPIPRIITSCIRVINLHGMHHQGVFRVSGSQAEISELKAGFERGEDPLICVQDARDINSTAGLLKLYFRELGEPLFPRSHFEDFVHCSRIENVEDCVAQLQNLVGTQLPKTVYVVMRYLFAFLNHLTEYSDENMMDPYNLAICFGPTLMPVPAERDQVQFQANVNDVVKTIITRHQDIFVFDIPGPRYDKCQCSRDEDGMDESTVDGDTEITDQSMDRTSLEDDDLRSTSESDAYSFMTVSSRMSSSLSSLPGRPATFERKASSFRYRKFNLIPNQPESVRGTAHSDFIGSSQRELTFRRGDELVLYRRLNPHWWEGRLVEGGRDGLIPDVYIKPRGSQALSSSGGAGGGAGSNSTEGTSTPDGSNSTHTSGVTGGGPLAPPGDVPSPSPAVENENRSALEKLRLELANDDAENDEDLESPVAKDKRPPSPPPSSSGDELESPASTEPTAILMRNKPASVDPVTATTPTTVPLRPLQEEVFGEDGGLEEDLEDGAGSKSGLVDEDTNFKLDEVMHGLASLEHRNTLYSRSATLDRSQELQRKLYLPSAKHTPDLVLDLPPDQLSAASSSSSVGVTNNNHHSNSAPVAGPSTADTFAEQGGDTMRKKPLPPSLLPVPHSTPRQSNDKEENNLSDEESHETLIPEMVPITSTPSSTSSLTSFVPPHPPLETGNSAVATASRLPPPVAPKPRRN